MRCLFAILLLLAFAAEAGEQNAPTSLLPPESAASDSILPADAAFSFNALIEAPATLALSWEMPPGYYLYRHSIALTRADGEELGNLTLPAARPLSDEFFGDVEVYYERLLLKIPISLVSDETGDAIELTVAYQGCAEGRYCYALQQKRLSIALQGRDSVTAMRPTDFVP